MKPWEDEREILLGGTALYSRALLLDDSDDCASLVRTGSNRKYLDWLFGSLAYARTRLPPQPGRLGCAGDPEIEDAFILLEALRETAAADDAKATRELLMDIKTAFSLDEHPLPLRTLDAMMELHAVVSTRRDPARSKDPEPTGSRSD